MIVGNTIYKILIVNFHYLQPQLQKQLQKQIHHEKIRPFSVDINPESMLSIKRVVTTRWVLKENFAVPHHLLARDKIKLI